MDRVIAYAGEVPLDTDVLQGQRNTHVAIGRLIGQLYGGGTTALGGFECAPGGGMTVIVQPGTITAGGTVDGTAYGSLAADQSALPQQYIAKNTTTLTVPTAAGTYFVYVLGGTADTGGTILPYFNAANPAQPFSGQANSGTAQPTSRAAVAVAAVGTAVPAGGFAVATIVVPASTTTITAAMITASTGPGIYPTIPQLVTISSFPAGNAGTNNTSSGLRRNPWDGWTEIYGFVLKAGSGTGNTYTPSFGTTMKQILSIEATIANTIAGTNNNVAVSLLDMTKFQIVTSSDLSVYWSIKGFS